MLSSKKLVYREKKLNETDVKFWAQPIANSLEFHKDLIILTVNDRKPELKQSSKPVLPNLQSVTHC